MTRKSVKQVSMAQEILTLSYRLSMILLIMSEMQQHHEVLDCSVWKGHLLQNFGSAAYTQTSALVRAHKHTDGF